MLKCCPNSAKINQIVSVLRIEFLDSGNTDLDLRREVVVVRAFNSPGAMQVNGTAYAPTIGSCRLADSVFTIKYRNASSGTFTTNRNVESHLGLNPVKRSACCRIQSGEMGQAKGKQTLKLMRVTHHCYLLREFVLSSCRLGGQLF